MTERKIRDAALGQRLKRLCDENPHVPEHNCGRLSWVKKQLSYHDISVSTETVRKWFAGEARPRPQKMAALAKVLTVDLASLSLGIGSVDDEEKGRLRRALKEIYCVVTIENDAARAGEIAKQALAGSRR